MDPDRTKRREIFGSLSQSFGKILPASFIRNPALPGVDRVHPLIEGIYKPAWSKYALSIASMLKSQYSDETHFNTDGTWWMHYSPKSGGMDLAANAALIRCMTDSEPLLILKQISTKGRSAGAQHRLLGLGLVEHFDPQRQLFRIRGVLSKFLPEYIDQPNPDRLLETAVRLAALEEWRPFAENDRAVYASSRQERDDAFREVVLTNYDRVCAVTGQKFVYSRTVEADAAHIIPIEDKGTDDPRNGLALSKSAHWAFDNGILTISDQYEILIHPEAKRASHSNFPLLQTDRKPLRLPHDTAFRPHQEALAWHRKERFGKFTRTP
jgi:hypothetical protein